MGVVRNLPEPEEKTRPEISLSRDFVDPCEYHFTQRHQKAGPVDDDRSRLLESFSTIYNTRLTSFDCMLIFLDSADPEVKIAAAGALGGLGDSRAIEPLFKACMDEDCRVKKAAHEALSKLGHKSL